MRQLACYNNDGINNISPRRQHMNHIAIFRMIIFGVSPKMTHTRRHPPSRFSTLLLKQTFTYPYYIYYNLNIATNHLVDSFQLFAFNVYITSHIISIENTVVHQFPLDPIIGLETPTNHHILIKRSRYFHHYYRECVPWL